tara:strand:- start:6168 stop:8117 length:1950 start_codon:yes stop_codon:yes gene_type:complete
MAKNFEHLKNDLMDVDEGFLFEEEPIEDSHQRLSEAEQTSDEIEKDFSERLRNPHNTKLVFSNNSFLVSDNVDLFVENSKIDNNLVDLIYQLKGNVSQQLSDVNFRLIAFDDTNVELLKGLNFGKLDREYEQLFLPKTNALRETFMLKGKEVVVEDFEVKNPNDQRQTKVSVKQALNNLIVYLIVYDTSEENTTLVFKLELLKEKQFSKTERIYDLRHTKDRNTTADLSIDLKADELTKQKNLHLFSKLHGSLDNKGDFRFLFGLDIGKLMKPRVAFPELLEENVLEDTIASAYIMRSRVERYTFVGREKFKSIPISIKKELFLDNSEGFLYFVGVDDSINRWSTYDYTVHLTTFDPTINIAKNVTREIMSIQDTILTATDETLRFELKRLYVFLLDLFDNTLPSEYKFLESIVNPNLKMGILKENVIILSHELYELTNWMQSRIDAASSPARKYREETATTDVSKLNNTSKNVANYHSNIEKRYNINFLDPLLKLNIEKLELSDGLPNIKSSDVKLSYAQAPDIKSRIAVQRGEIPLVRSFSESTKKSKLSQRAGVDIKTKTEQDKKTLSEKGDSVFLVEENFFIENVNVEYLVGYNVDLLGEFESITSENWQLLTTSVLETFPVGTSLVARLALADSYENKYFFVEK